MSNIDKGVLLLYEWCDAMTVLSGEEYKALMEAIIHSQRDNTPPPKFTGVANAIASIILPYIERRKQQAERGRAGAAVRYERENKSTAVVQASANVTANSTANGTANGTANDQNKNKIKNKNKFNLNRERNINSADSGWEAATVGFDYSADADALALREDKKDDSDADMPDKLFCADNSYEGNEFGYGRYRNVYLSTEEYLQIKQVIPNADEFIESFSQKLHDKGYRYPNHAKAILDWYKRDSALPASRPQGSYSPPAHYSHGYFHDYSGAPAPPPSNESFPTFDEFFDAAVRRSLGEASE